MNAGGGVSSTQTQVEIAKAFDSPVTANPTEVQRGCIIKAFYLTLDVCGLGGTGVLNIADFYIIKNPDGNLTEPPAGAVGQTNEKKFIFKTWRAMIMRNQDGNVPYHWEGWIKVPKRYQRMGTDDELNFNIVCTSAVTGHFSLMSIYKWYT